MGGHRVKHFRGEWSLGLVGRVAYECMAMNRIFYDDLHMSLLRMHPQRLSRTFQLVLIIVPRRCKPVVMAEPRFGRSSAAQLCPNIGTFLKDKHCTK
jgi:hypothetical protein